MLYQVWVRCGQIARRSGWQIRTANIMAMREQVIVYGLRNTNYTAIFRPA